MIIKRFVDKIELFTAQKWLFEERQIRIQRAQAERDSMGAKDDGFGLVRTKSDNRSDSDVSRVAGKHKISN